MTQPSQSNIPGKNPQPYRLPQTLRNITLDAVVVVPGIMGSELYDNRTDTVLWGIADPGWISKAWLSDSGLTPLHLTEDEQLGRTDRVTARRLLQTPAWSPFLRGIEPYHDLLAAISTCVAHPDAVLPFPYDWRLSVATNARRLADDARQHLTRWRAHDALQAARRHTADERPARLVFIAHSMGGLITHAALTLGHDNDLTDDTRGVMTLGTPFHGSVLAAQILNTGQGSPIPLPHSRLRALAAAMPGVHDLLPRFPCLDEGLDVRRLTPTDVADLGGDKDLAAASQAFHDRQSPHPLPRHRAVAGIRQPTLQSLTLDNGRVTASHHRFAHHADGELRRDVHGVPLRFEGDGDGTVHRQSAVLAPGAMPIALQHGALAQGEAALQIVTDFLVHEETFGPDQADGGLGLELPDYVTARTEWDLHLTGTDDPAGIDCTVTGVDTAHQRDARLHATDDETLTARVSVPEPGLYRITVRSPTTPALTQLVLAGPDTPLLPEAE
ncbi:esterase/lipase family protein [Streptomyces sp. NPDC048612]|uniref:esterase/lipase family protein n=1 Tax=Streptomyces sp. NPDC048612 TaxID=3365579 RepID=UPI00371B2CD6